MRSPEPRLPPTPPAQLRPFERLAVAGSDLARGCWTWILLLLGVPTWPMVGGLAAVLAALGAWWRFLSLRSCCGVLDTLAPRAWMALSAASGTVGLVLGCVMCLAGLGVPVPDLGWLLPAWAGITAFEIAAAMLWVVRGAWERNSRWMVAPIGVAATLMLACVGAHALAASQPSRPAFVTALLFAAVVAGAAAGPWLVGDGASRLLASMASESLDEENDEAASGSGGTRSG